MQLLQFSAVRLDNGVALPRAKATVYLAGTTTKADLFNAAGASVGNPVSADDNALVAFAAANGAYDVALASEDGSYTVPMLAGVQLYDLTELDAKVASVPPLVAEAEGYRDEAEVFAGNAGTARDEVREVVDIVSYDEPDMLAAFVDVNLQIYGKVGLDAGWDILLKQLATIDGMSVYAYDTVGVAAPVTFVDANGYILWEAPLPGTPDSAAEVVTARGSRGALDTRLSQAFDAYGSPKDSFNANRLRQYHYRRRKRLLTIPESVQNVVAIFGDSYSHNITRYSGDLAATMIAEQGDGGGGWTGFGFNTAAATFTHGGTQPTLMNGNVRATYGVSLNGAWDKAYATVPSPDTCCAISTSAGAEIRATFPAAPALSGAELFWIGTADGVMEYSWNGSSWTTINVQGTVGACSHAALTGFGAGAGTLYLRVVSGTCKPAGVNWKSTASGVVFHKLAASGSKMSQLAPQAATASWKTAVAALGITTAIVMHGTNDQGTAPIRSPDEFATDGETVMNNLVAAIPSIDRLWAMPPENQRTGMTFAMPLYKAAAAAKAAALGVAFLDHQRNFGDPANPTEYGAAGATPLFNADLIHPEPATGGRVLLDGFLRFLNAA